MQKFAALRVEHKILIQQETHLKERWRVPEMFWPLMSLNGEVIATARSEFASLKLGAGSKILDKHCRREQNSGPRGGAAMRKFVLPVLVLVFAALVARADSVLIGASNPGNIGAALSTTQAIAQPFTLTQGISVSSVNVLVGPFAGGSGQVTVQ